MADDSRQCVRVDMTTRNGQLADIDRGWDEVANLDRDIFELIQRRKWLVYDTIDETRVVSGVGNLLGIDPGILRNEYFSHRFESETVKQAVLGVRSLFFDDSKEAFRRFNCLEMVFETDRICDDYCAYVDSFSFVDMNDLRHKMTISIPTIRSEHYLYSTTLYGADDEHIYVERGGGADDGLVFPDGYEKRCRCAGNIGVYISVDSSFNRCVCSSMDIDVVRKRIADVVYDYGWEVKTAMERQASLLNGYSS